MKPVQLNCDDQSANHVAKNLLFHERTKRIEVDCHFTRDKVLEGLLQLSYLPTKNQLAGIFTKILPSCQHITLSSKLGMVNVLPTPSSKGGVCVHCPSSTANSILSSVLQCIKGSKDQQQHRPSRSHDINSNNSS